MNSQLLYYAGTPVALIAAGTAAGINIWMIVLPLLITGCVIWLEHSDQPTQPIGTGDARR